MFYQNIISNKFDLNWSTTFSYNRTYLTLEYTLAYNIPEMLVINVGVNPEKSLQNSFGYQHEILGKRNP